MGSRLLEILYCVTKNIREIPRRERLPLLPHSCFRFIAILQKNIHDYICRGAHCASAGRETRPLQNLGKHLKDCYNLQITAPF